MAETVLTSKGECAETGANKRIRLEHNILSPSEDRQSKRPKISDHESYAQATKGIIKTSRPGRPDRKLGDDEIDASRKLIR